LSRTSHVAAFTVAAQESLEHRLADFELVMGDDVKKKK